MNQRYARQKGITFEREIAAAFEAVGFQVHGLEAGGDHFVVAAGGQVMHGEAKRHERLRIPEWIAQQERDCPAGLRRFLAFRQSYKDAYVIEPLAQFVGRERLLSRLPGVCRECEDYLAGDAS